MGTAGSLSLVGDLQEHFLVVNGDVLTGLDFGAFFRRHTSRGAAASIGLCRREAAIDFGVVDLDGAGRLLEYREKPRLPYFVSMGINAFHRRSLAHLKPNEALGMPDFFLRLKAAGELVCGDVCDVDWLDIGRRNLGKFLIDTNK
jgi:mannose-1-phosphate guanylyltransferase